MANAIHDIPRAAIDLRTAEIDLTASGNSNIIAAVSGQTLKITDIVLSTAASGSVELRDGTTTTISGAILVGTTGILQIHHDVDAPLQLTRGNGFNINLTGAATADGYVIYYVDD